MALRPNANPFIPGTGGNSQSSSAISIKQSYYNTPTPPPSSSSSSSSLINKTPSRPLPKARGQTPRGNQGKRVQSGRKTEKKGRLTDDALDADPIIDTVMYGPANRRGEVSLNHLLNFSIAPRQHYNFNPPARRTYSSYGIGSGHHPADKSRFIQANHRFVVRPNGDYRTQYMDADAPIAWESILQILVSPQTHMMACPICLSETPVAPRMTQCGHIACLPCFIRYFASEDVATGLRGASLKFRKCPICWDSIQLSELKPVRWYSIHDGMEEKNVLVASEPREGFDVAMRLFMRKPGSTLSLPRDDYLAFSQMAVIPEGDVPWHYVPEIMHYAWIVKGSGSYMHAQAEQEIQELEIMEKDDETAFGEDGFWTQRAIQRVHDTSLSYDDIGEGPARQANLSLAEATRRVSSTTVPEDIPYHLQISQGSSPRLNHQRDTPYLYYQPRSGSHYYLSALDIRILKRAYGDYENFPSAILARVEHITSPQTVDDDFRRRIKYLGNLPSGCQISFLECDWSEIVDTEILTQFSLEIEKRRRTRREKLVREEKEREAEERNRRLTRRGGSEEDTFVATPTKETEDVRWVIANAMASVQSGTSLEPMSASSPPLASSPPGVGHKLSTSADSTVQRTVWGTPKVTPAVSTPVVVPSTAKEPVDDESDGPGESGGMWVQNWEEMLKADREASKVNGNRRKKGKKLVLMSNSVQRGS